MRRIDPRTVENALRKIDKYAMEDGDIGGAEWREVGQLISEAASMQSLIVSLKDEIHQLSVRLQLLERRS